MTTLEPSKNSRYIVLDALGILAQNLGPITARRLKAGGIWHFNANGRSSAVRDLPQTRDASRVLAAMRSYWNEAFEPHFEYGESRRVRQLVAQVIDIRNTYEGHPVGDYRYADEALVDIRRLLEAFSAVEGVQQVSALKQELAQLMLNDSSVAPPAPKDFSPPATPAASAGQSASYNRSRNEQRYQICRAGHQAKAGQRVHFIDTRQRLSANKATNVLDRRNQQYGHQNQQTRPGNSFRCAGACCVQCSERRRRCPHWRETGLGRSRNFGTLPARRAREQHANINLRCAYPGRMRRSGVCPGGGSETHPPAAAVHGVKSMDGITGASQ